LQIDIGAMPPALQYKLISSTVVPRPIALITTWSDSAGHNAAPFSFFNAMGENPPVLIVSLENKRDSGGLKDTTLNIQENGQFVIHMVDEPMAEAMNVCAIDFPHGINEIEEAGLTLLPSARVRPHRIAEAPIAFECEMMDRVQVGPGRHIVIGKIAVMHIREGLLDPATHYIDIDAYRPVGRMFGRLYTRTREQFELVVPSYDNWRLAKADTDIEGGR